MKKKKTPPPKKNASVALKGCECVHTVAKPEGKTTTDAWIYRKRISPTCQRGKIKHLTFCAWDQSGFFDMGDILEAAYFCNSRTDLSTNIQNLIKHAIMLTALNSIQWKKRLQATFEEGKAGNKIMQMSVNLRNQRVQISSLLVTFSATNAASTDEGLQPDFHYQYSTKKRRGRQMRKGVNEHEGNERSGDGDKCMWKHRARFSGISTPNIKLAKWMVQDKVEHRESQRGANERGEGGGGISKGM